MVAASGHLTLIRRTLGCLVIASQLGAAVPPCLPLPGAPTPRPFSSVSLQARPPPRPSLLTLSGLSHHSQGSGASCPRWVSPELSVTWPGGMGSHSVPGQGGWAGTPWRGPPSRALTSPRGAWEAR